jgi:cellobiose-specific phosphotransferase system component IIC
MCAQRIMASSIETTRRVVDLWWRVPRVGRTLFVVAVGLTYTLLTDPSSQRQFWIEFIVASVIVVSFLWIEGVHEPSVKDSRE